jgi:hypothetical protein
MGKGPAAGRLARLFVAACLCAPGVARAVDFAPAILALEHGQDLHDAREPLRMPAHMAAHQKANMRQHLEVLAAIVAALAREDYSAIAVAASTMGATPETVAMCRHMGAGGPADFTTRALAFHDSADRLATAARSGDRAKVLPALGETLASCTGCHARYRQEVVAAQP